MQAVHFACDLTSLLRHRNSEKKTSTRMLMLFGHQCGSELKTFSAEVGPEIVPTVIQGF